MTQDELLRRAMDTVAARRQRAVTRAREAQQAAQTQLPQLAQLQSEKALAGINATRLAVSGAVQSDIDASLARVRAADEAVTQLLAQNGIDAQSLEPQYTCPVCKDTGRADGKTCACVSEVLRTLRRNNVNEASPLALCSFDTFSLARYPETQEPDLGITAREQMAQILTYCKEYAAHFAPHASSLYLCGYAGLGKTHLALSIANEVLSRGFDVVYVSAQDAFSHIEDEHFKSGGNTLDTLLHAGLLILDDLGTEYLSAYVGACLYDLINTRCVRRLPTIYTSNIVSDADLRRRYTEKIVSRLLGSCEVLCCCGEDIRLQGKAE